MAQATLELVKHDYKEGDDVSYGFNGDWYYDGKVTRITKMFLTTDSGNKYSLKVINDRKKVTDANGFTDYVDCKREIFKSTGHGTWSLAHGVIREQNPHF